MADHGQREGQHLGNYRLMRLLGRGSWASVYLGEHWHLHTQAAIKILHGQWADSEVEGFLNEARTLAHLRHPHIVRVLDFGVQEDTPFLVMEYAPGGTLRQLHPKGTRLPLATVVFYVKQVASGLQYAHEQRLVHRDLKPENLLLGPDQEILLSDFGLAIVAYSVRSQPFQQAAGSLAYMAPEQLEGHPTPASDQYALGVLVYEWLAGERPFSGSLPELLVKQTQASPPRLSERVSTLPVGVEQVVLQALAKDPQLRFASVQDFAVALQEECQPEGSSGQTLLVLSSHRYTEARQAPRHNLPAQLTPLIGREQGVTACCALLRRSEVRLLTLTGTGGVGKTRLALQVATDLLDDFADGVHFISLAPISDPDLVIPTIAQTLGIKETGTQPLLDLLKASLQKKHLLLVLDNFEQILSAAPQLTDLLTSCPQLKLLVTSRSTLHVQGEHEFPVLPLAVPDLKQLPEQEALAQYAAIALFLQRVQAVKPTFQSTTANAAALAEVCIRLDGLPLAIELAAARIKLLSPQALLARLDRRLQVLTQGSQDLPERQRTLRDTIQWSYDLLPPEEQRLFRWLAIFVGGCTLEAVEAVYKGDNETTNVLEGVASLLDKSLLQQEQVDAEQRFMMLETIREYGLECLLASGETETAQRTHAEYYLALADEAKSKLRGAQQHRWLAQLEQEHNNLRAALNWLIERDIEMALRLGVALSLFWTVRGQLSEGRRWLERALASSSTSVSARAKALNSAAMLAIYQGDHAHGATLCSESLGLFRELGNKQGIGDALKGLALATQRGGNYVAAQAMYEECLALVREVGSKWDIADALYHTAFVKMLLGDAGVARSLTEEALALFRALEDQRGIAYSLALLGMVSLQQGDPAMARSLLEENLMVFRALGDRQAIVYTLTGLGLTSLAEGDFVGARTRYEECLALLKETGDKVHIFSCLLGLGGAAAGEGQLEWAARLWGAAETLREAVRAPIPPLSREPYEQALVTVRIQLNEEVFATAWAEGRTMTPEQALAAQGPVTKSTTTPEGPSSVPQTPKAPTYPAGLTAREVEVLRLVAQGLTDAQVAAHLVISPRTVNWHLTSIYSKLQVTSRSAATRYAMEHYLI